MLKGFFLDYYKLMRIVNVFIKRLENSQINSFIQEEIQIWPKH